MPAQIAGDKPRWLQQPERLFVGGSVATAVLAVAAECCGSPLEMLLLAANVTIISLWITCDRPGLTTAVVLVTLITIAFAWLGGTPEPALFQPILLATGVGWRMRDLGRSLTCAAALALVPLVGDLGPGADWGWWNWSIGAVFAWSLGRIIRNLEATHAKLAAARASLVASAARDERRRIARDVHDLVGHSLTAMLLNVRAARQALGADPETTASALDDAVRIGTAGLADIRASMPSLRDVETADGDDQRLQALPDGRSLLALLAEYSDMATTVRGDVESLRGPVAVATFRIVQECLTNIVRHARPGTASLSLEVNDRAVRLISVNEVLISRDAKLSVERERHPSFGLTGIGERVSSLGGRYSAGREGRHFRIDCEIPRQ